MFAILNALGMFIVDMFKSRGRIEAENLFLRHQLNIALRRAPSHLRLRGADRALRTILATSAAVGMSLSMLGRVLPISRHLKLRS